MKQLILLEYVDQLMCSEVRLPGFELQLSSVVVVWTWTSFHLCFSLVVSQWDVLDSCCRFTTNLVT